MGTIAVYLPMIGSAVPAWVWVAGLLVAAGLSPLATWGARSVRSQLARRFLLAVVVAVVLSLTVGVGTAQAIIIGPCDSAFWWLWFC